MSDEKPKDETDESTETSVDKIKSPVIRRLVEEVRNEKAEPKKYNRFHNRHNRGSHNRHG